MKSTLNLDTKFLLNFEWAPCCNLYCYMKVRLSYREKKSITFNHSRNNQFVITRNYAIKKTARSAQQCCQFLSVTKSTFSYDSFFYLNVASLLATSFAKIAFSQTLNFRSIVTIQPPMSFDV